MKQDGYPSRLLRSALPYVLFYIILACMGVQLQYGWLIPLPVLIIGLFKVMPGSRYALRSIELQGEQVHVRYADYNVEHSSIVPLSQIKVTLKRDPSTIHKHFVLDIEGPGVHVRQYERGPWNRQKMERVLIDMAPHWRETS